MVNGQWSLVIIPRLTPLLPLSLLSSILGEVALEASTPHLSKEGYIKLVSLYSSLVTILTEKDA
jgi:hypothetical protein